MQKMNLDEIRKCQFEILCYVDSACEKLGIKYSLIGGTLLGAVRHKGFIPWDDDIDISMLRTDYETFVEYCKNDKSFFKVITNKTEPNWKDIYAKVIDTRTIIHDQLTSRYEYNCGVFIDLFPVDALGDTYDEALKKFNKSSFNREMLNAVKWKKYERSKTRPWYYEFIRFPFFVLSRVMNPDKLINNVEAVYRNGDFDKTKYVVVVAGVYREKEIMPYEVYREYTSLEFEGRSFSCIKQYDYWLSKVYGDYMKLPPKEKQITHHTFKAFYTNK